MANNSPSRSVIHPAAQKRAASYGAQIIAVDGKFRLVNVATSQLSEGTYDMVAECGEALQHKEVVWESPKTPQGAKSGVMVRSYHEQYSKNPNGPGCGDDLDVTLREAITLLDEKGKPYADKESLVRIGVENNLYRDTWNGLNVGMIRMNLSNRMRGWLRQNGSHEVTIGGHTGRFGVEARAPKASKKA